ncbi:MAG: mannose-1-phosphate guanylyltransferase [Bdellovibrionia bacterium]
MQFQDAYLVIIAGGSGTRFWPKSTAQRPKQLLSFGGSSLLAQTLDRFKELIPAERRMILTTQSLKDAVLAQNPQATVLGEPQGRNTAPCIYWAAQKIAEENPKALMLVMPSDHYIANRESFLSTTEQAMNWAKNHSDLVTLGIEPSRAETGYGYLQIDSLPIKPKEPHSPHRVLKFVEKPNLARAQEFIQSKNYLWNGGMFIWRVDTLLEAFDEYMPEMKRAWNETHGEVEKAYPLLTATSIDYGVMEKAQNVVTFPLTCGWDDLGSWTSLESLASVLHAQKDQNVVTEGDVVSLDSRGNIVDAPGKLIALLGIEDLIIVEHGGAILVAKKERAQDIRTLVERLKKTHPHLI